MYIHMHMNNTGTNHAYVQYSLHTHDLACLIGSLSFILIKLRLIHQANSIMRLSHNFMRPRNVSQMRRKSAAMLRHAVCCFKADCHTRVQRETHTMASLIYAPNDGLCPYTVQTHDVHECCAML